ncbi:hypothetical protein M0804_013290 [Polistes exclamans]|nr:hypothetical protein M0804_013290 [Polistes exclamans]
MRNENSFKKVKAIFYYRNEALTMMNIFKQQEEGFFLMWLNKFEYVADMIEVPNNKMANLFLAMLHENAHEPVMRNYTNVKFTEISYKEIIEYYNHYYSLSFVHNLHRRRFTLRKQYAQESITKYANNLKKLITKCGNTMLHSKILCKQFIDGIREKEIRNYLNRSLSEFPRDISFDGIVSKAVAFEKENDINYYLNPAFSMINIYDTKKKVDFSAWINKFEYVAKMIEVPDNRMIEFFYKMVENDVHQRVSKTFSSVRFPELSYEKIINHYLYYFASTFESDLYRRRIMCRFQYEQETIMEYANNLKEMYKKCNKLYRKEINLCEQFVGGIRDDDIRSHLNKLNLNLSFDETVAKAIAFLEGNQITHYLSQALSMMNIFKLEEKTFFPMWFNKFEYVTDMIEVPNDKMGELFIKIVHVDIDNFIIWNAKYVNISELTYEKIINSYFQYIYLTSSDKIILFNRRRFTYRNQYVQEPIEEYSNNLKKLYYKCNYIRDKERELREKFVNGIRDDDLRNHLKIISGLSFKKMVAEPISFEKANDMSHYLKPALSIINAYNPMKEGMFHAWLNKLEYVANIIKVPDNKLDKFFIKMVENNVHTNLFLDMEEFEFHRIRLNYREQYVAEPILRYAILLEKIYRKSNYIRKDEIKLCSQFVKGMRSDISKTPLRILEDIPYIYYVKGAYKLSTVCNIDYYTNQAILIINIYNPKQDADFHDWLNKFEYIANMIRVPNHKMATFFSKMVDHDVYESIVKTYSSIDFSKHSYDQLINCYIQYFTPFSYTDLQRKRFINRYQYKDEAIKKYAHKLRKLYIKCCYTDQSEEMLCEQFLRGIRDNDLRTHLSETFWLTLNDILVKAFAYLKDNQTNYYFNQALSMINVFKLEKEDSFLNWLMKFESIVNSIEVPYKVIGILFLTMVNDDVHKLIINDSQTLNVSELSYDQILDRYRYLFFGIDKLKLYRTRFAERKQYAEEPIEKYAESLQKLYSNCDYESYLEEKLNELHGKKKKIFLNNFVNPSFTAIEINDEEFTKVIDVSRYVKPALKMINIYNPDKEDNFYEWFNKFEYVADTVGVPDAKMIKFFDAMVNNDTHNIVKQKFSSVKFSELTYDEITNHYLRYYTPFYESDLHKKRFMCRNQYEQEPLQKYANNLRKIYNNCSAINRTKDTLIERFVNGICDSDIRYHLENKSPGLSFYEMVEEAIKLEKTNDITYYVNLAFPMINIYNPSKEEKFYDWLNKFEFVADFIRVPNNLMVKFFRRMIEYDMHKSVMQMFPGIKYFSLSYDSLINLYLLYFSFPCEFKFNKQRLLSRKQYENETIDNYAESLFKLYDKFVDKSRMNEELCEQFLIGIRNDNLRNYLSKNPCLLFYETILKAIKFEKTNDISKFLNEALTKINIFDPATEGIFSEWINKFEFIADSIKIPDTKMIELFDKMVKNDIHTIVKEAYPTINFSELLYKDKIIYYLRYFNSIQQSDFDKKKHLRSENQCENGTTEQHSNSLEIINDKHDNKNYLEQKLCEQFIYGIRNSDIKMHLSKTSHTSFDELVAKAIELSKETNISESKEE